MSPRMLPFDLLSLCVVCTFATPHGLITRDAEDGAPDGHMSATWAIVSAVISLLVVVGVATTIFFIKRRQRRQINAVKMRRSSTLTSSSYADVEVDEQAARLNLPNPTTSDCIPTHVGVSVSGSDG
ncbi:hypothetical protein A0H81_14271 [Grifola frondosa]|uniref:Uncharacterized protein n=1 Tax=Grifola frondosa TaxID=5627 RepID=A0A1C7LM12_GRIFR|nr:hypothetical protein A0H81_14271 [Grifola frondosa]